MEILYFISIKAYFRKVVAHQHICSLIGSKESVLSSWWPRCCRRANIQHTRGPHRPFRQALPGTSHHIQMCVAGRDAPAPYKAEGPGFLAVFARRSPPVSRCGQNRNITGQEKKEKLTFADPIKVMK